MQTDKLKSTPGPWEVKHSESKSAFNIVGTQLGGKYKLARVPYLVDDRLGELNDTWKQEAEANAKLIAAAPELLEALELNSKMLDMLILATPSGEERNAFCNLNIITKSAIAKATS
jgi:hypothetical protein